MSHTVKVITASRCATTGKMIFTIHARYWRGIHSELMTHRVLSRNAGSSRAKPVKKVLAQVWNDPAGPIHWGANQAGMQARGELSGWRRAVAETLWKWSGRAACAFAWGMMKVSLHKQVANRILEPWQYIDVLITSTEWDNFFELRCHPDAQPEFRALAESIRSEMVVVVGTGQYTWLQPGEWHLPWIMPEEVALPLADKLKLSSARAARVSYEPFDGDASHAKEFQRHNLLVGSRPLHASPTEHQAECLGEDVASANFRGFRQYRWYLERGLEVPGA